MLLAATVAIFFQLFCAAFAKAAVDLFFYFFHLHRNAFITRDHIDVLLDHSDAIAFTLPYYGLPISASIYLLRVSQKACH